MLSLIFNDIVEWKTEIIIKGKTELYFIEYLWRLSVL